MNFILFKVINYIRYIVALELIARLLVFILDGIVICVSDLQEEKALLPIEVTEEGISIFTSDVHDWKAYSPIDVTEGGINTCVSDVQL